MQRYKIFPKNNHFSVKDLEFINILCDLADENGNAYFSLPTGWDKHTVMVGVLQIKKTA